MELQTGKHTTWILVGLIALVSFLSLLFFSNQSIRLDESQSLWQASHSPARIFSIIAEDVHVPLYHQLLHAWQRLFSSSVEMARFFSLVFFILSIPALYLLGNYAFRSRSVGIFAATLLAISPFMNWYGNEVRMYTLFTFFTILSHYLFLKLYREAKGWHWGAFAIVSLLGIFTHYFFFLVLFSQALFFFGNRRAFPEGSLRRFGVLCAVIAIAFLPWAIAVWMNGFGARMAPLLDRPETINIFLTLEEFVVGFHNDHLTSLVVALWPVVVIFLFLALQRRRSASPEAFYFLLSSVVPIAVVFLVSLTITPVFVSRYMIFTVPTLYLLVSWVFSTYPTGIAKVLKTTLVIAMLAGLTNQALSATTPVKEEYRDVAAYLSANATPQDIIVLSAPFTIFPVEYYYQGRADIKTIPLWNRFVSGAIPSFDPEKLPGEVKQIIDGRRRVFLVLSYDQGYEEQIRRYFESNFHRLEEKNYSRGLNLYVYKVGYQFDDDELTFDNQEFSYSDKSGLTHR